MAESDSRVTVIPPTNEALQAVTTKYLAFEHDFTDMPGRYERQADFLDTLGDNIFWTIGDVWPGWLVKPYARSRMRRAVRGAPTGKFSYKTYLWPETMLLRTTAAKLFEIDERITYRPAMWLWAKMYESMQGAFVDQGEVATEPVIKGADRARHPIPDDYPTITFPAAEMTVSAIMVVDNHEATVAEAIQAFLDQTITNSELLIVDCGSTDESMTIVDQFTDTRITTISAGRLMRSLAFNEGLKLAKGDYIACWDAHSTYTKDRLEKQLQLSVDLCGSEYTVDSRYLQPDPDHVKEVRSDLFTESTPRVIHAATSMRGRTPMAMATLVVHRRVFEKLGGMSSLPCRYGQQLILRALADPDISLAKVREDLAFCLRVNSDGEWVAPNDDAHYCGTYYYNLVGRDLGANYRADIGGEGWHAATD